MILSFLVCIEPTGVLSCPFTTWNPSASPCSFFVSHSDGRELGKRFPFIPTSAATPQTSMAAGAPLDSRASEEPLPGPGAVLDAVTGAEPDADGAPPLAASLTQAPASSLS